MGTDYLHLFNKGLADEILSMDRDSFARFVDRNYAKIRKDVVVFWKAKGEYSALEAIETLISMGSDLLELKREVAMEVAFESDAEGNKQTIYLDYWGCFSEVFDDDIQEGMIRSGDYMGDCGAEPFGDGDEAIDHFYLLTPQHID